MLTLLALWAATTGHAGAQEISLDPSAAARCLTVTDDRRQLPTYPFDEWKLGQKGRVLVELKFNAPDKPPDVEVLEGDGVKAFVSAVREHATTYRVPCLGAAPARLRLEFIFKPDDRKVYGSEPEDADDPRRAALLKCLQHISGNTTPPYPREAQRLELDGRVLARLTFVAADQPPQVQVFGPPSTRVLSRAIENFSKDYRLPCFEGPGPLNTSFLYLFKLEGNGPVGLKPLDLLAFMGSVRGIQRQALQFDTTAMACPFDVKLEYLQPYLPNKVGEIGSREIARQPLLNWLAQQHLELPRRSLDAAFADSTTITVPCAKIDLKPQETS